MFATLLAALAVVIALQALRLASRDRIVIQVRPEDLAQPSSPKKPQLPHFLNQPRTPEARPVQPEWREAPAESERRYEISFLQGRPLDVNPN